MMNNTNVEPAGEKAASDAAMPEAILRRLQQNTPSVSAAVMEKRSRRRSVLLGGAAVGGLASLANSNALAGTTRVCTVSAIASQTASATLNPECGNSPGCWRNNAVNTWAPNSVFP